MMELEGTRPQTTRSCFLVGCPSASSRSTWRVCRHLVEGLLYNSFPPLTYCTYWWEWRTAWGPWNTAWERRYWRPARSARKIPERGRRCSVLWAGSSAFSEQSQEDEKGGRLRGMLSVVLFLKCGPGGEMKDCLAEARD